MAAKDTSPLNSILRNVFNKLAQSEPNSMERRNALASIENIKAELTSYYC